MEKRIFLPVLAAFVLFASACTDYKTQMDQLLKVYDAASSRTVDVAPAADVTAPYLVVVNGSWQGRCSIDAGFDDIVYSIDHDGEFTEHLGGSQASFVLAGGDMMVFKYR